MTTLVATIIVLGVLIFVHELGHFLAAKMVDIRVERFSIGLGPKVWGTRRGETEYVLSAIPLGGYVKMGGMDDEIMEKIEGGATGSSRTPGARDFDAKPVWQRAYVISAGVIMNLLFAFLAYTIVAVFWGSPTLDTRRVGTVEAERLPGGTEALAEIPTGSELVQIGERSVEHWGDIEDAFQSAPAGQLTVRTADPAVVLEVTLGDDPLERLEMLRAIDFWLPAAVESVLPGSPAEEAGLRRGDLIVAIDDQPVRMWSDLVAIISARPGEEVELTLERGGQPLSRAITPAAEQEVDPATGEERTVGKIGLRPPLEALIRYRPVSLAQAIPVGADATVRTTSLILGFLRDLVSGNVSPRSVGSIGAIAEMSGEAARRGMAQFLDFMALFSINLAVLNLLPIPILDGGHLVFLVIEAIRGRALSIEQRARWSQVGLVIVMGIMILALSNDLRRWLGF